MTQENKLARKAGLAAMLALISVVVTVGHVGAVEYSGLVQPPAGETKFMFVSEGIPIFDQAVKEKHLVPAFHGWNTECTGEHLTATCFLSRSLWQREQNAHNDLPNDTK